MCELHLASPTAPLLSSTCQANRAEGVARRLAGDLRNADFGFLFVSDPKAWACECGGGASGVL